MSQIKRYLEEVQDIKNLQGKIKEIDKIICDLKKSPIMDENSIKCLTYALKYLGLAFYEINWVLHKVEFTKGGK